MFPLPLQALADVAGSPFAKIGAALLLVEYARRIVCRQIDWWNTRPLRPKPSRRGRQSHRSP
jgi:hypothetical protein